MKGVAYSFMDNEKKAVICVSDEDVGKRLDVLISEDQGISRSAAVRLIEQGRVTVNGTVPQKNSKPRSNDTVEIEYPPIVAYEAVAEDISLDIVYEDGDIIVINKPSGMVVHPAAGNYSGTLVNALLHHCKDSLSGIGGVARPGIVHRIDKDTSGLLVVAKNDEAHISLTEQLKTHTVSRVYFAIAVGNFREDSGTVSAPIGRHPVDRKKMAVYPSGDDRAKEAVTHYTVLERYNGFCLVRCELETGRTHQIRVHMAHKGHPLLGDAVYGGDKTKFYSLNKDIISGQCLHAGKLRFKHPRTGVEMEFEAPMPDDMRVVIDKLRRMN